MAQLTYNGLTLAFCNTERVGHKSVTDPSGADQLYTATEIHVTGILNSLATPADLLSGGGLESPVETIARIKHLLMLPRRQLIFTQFGVNGVKTYISNPDPAADGTPPLVDDTNTVYLDDANGPTPLRCDVTRLTEVTFLVDYAVKISLVDCANPNYDPLTGALSLRWSENTTYDGATWLCTKTRTGLLVASSRAALAPDSDAARRLVTPLIPAGFRRTSAKYAIDDTNLRYRFTFVDKQVMKMPPPPVSRVRGSMTVSQPLSGGKRTGKIHLTLTGPRGLPTVELLNAGIRIALARVYKTNVSKTSAGAVVTGYTVTESLDDDKNEIRLTVQWVMASDGARATGTTVTPVGTDAIGDLMTPVPAVVTAYRTALAALAPSGPSPALALDPSWIGQPYMEIDPTSTTGRQIAANVIAPPTRGAATAVGLVAAILNDPCGLGIAPQS